MIHENKVSVLKEETKILEEEKLIENRDYLKVFLVFFMKGFTWQKELEFQFNITTNQVKKAIPYLELKGFLISKDFYSLDLDTQNTIRILNAPYVGSIDRFPKVYTLSKEGKEFGALLKDELEILLEEDSSFRMTYDLIAQKTQGYNKLKDKFEIEESNKSTRQRIDYNSGVVFEVDTQKTRNFKKDFALANAEIKREKLLENSDTQLFLDKVRDQKLLIASESENIVVSNANSPENSLMVIDNKSNQIVLHQNSEVLVNNSEKRSNMLALCDIDESRLTEEEKHNYHLVLCENKHELVEYIEAKELEKNLTKMSSLEMAEVDREVERYRRENKIIQEELDKDIEVKEEIKKLREEGKDVPQISGLGKDIHEVDANHKDRVDALFDMLGINEEEPVKDKAEKIQVENSGDICGNLIDEIKEKGWLNYDLVKKLCGTTEVFNRFKHLSSLEKIVEVGDDFIYTR